MAGGPTSPPPFSLKVGSGTPSPTKGVRPGMAPPGPGYAQPQQQPAGFPQPQMQHAGAQGLGFVLLNALGKEDL